jgi:glycosyltransferase involved in cell wall biosynthesis
LKNHLVNSEKPVNAPEEGARDHHAAADAPGGCEVSIVIPCLNEADTLASCLQKAQQALRDLGTRGEVIVADNGSSDGCPDIAAAMGARVVQVAARGYGSALMGGIAAASGRYVVMGDADDSYDFREVPKFVAKLREGFDLVQGCRLPRGGGRVLPGAMPFLHRAVGNPLFSLLARRWFRSPVHDIYCGMRGFTGSLYRSLAQRCTGMEFATEMIIKASLFGRKITEVPITLHPDGRKSHPPHLRTFRDGWRTLRFFLLYSPGWLFYRPGLALILLGLLGYGVALPGCTLFGATFDAHTLLFASLAAMIGYQCVLFAVFTKTFAASEGLAPHDHRLVRLYRWFPLERGLLAGAAGFLAGVALLAGAVDQWRAAHLGPLDYAHTMRWVIPGTTLAALGFQTVLASFFVSILGLSRK